MRQPHGYLIITDPARPTYEADTVTCGHCNRIVVTQAGTGATVYLLPHGAGWREVAGAFCRLCMRPVCLACHARGTCDPWERQVEQIERRAGR